jgi:hypothetical protein
VPVVRTPPRWSGPALGGLLIATAVLYLVGLAASGTANSFRRLDLDRDPHVGEGALRATAADGSTGYDLRTSTS